MIVDEEMEKNVVEVVRKSDKKIMVKLIPEKKMKNVLSAYIPQNRMPEKLLRQLIISNHLTYSS